MPPFKAGLLKRKIDAKESKKAGAKASSDDEGSESGENEDLIRGDLNGTEDATDSEQEGEGANSDTEQDEVLFDDDADSTFGDEEQEEDASDASSELIDSEADDESEENSEEDHDENEAESAESEPGDSGAESGIGQTHSGSSDESDTNVKQKVKKKTKQKRDAQEQSKEKQSKQKQMKNQKGIQKDSVDLLADKIKETSVKMQPVAQKDEYESGDTSDEEERRNTVGDIPMWWYNEYPHVGYDLDGRKIIKPPQRDQIDEFLKKCEDPEFWRTVRDPHTGQDVILSKQDLQLISRIRQGQVPDAQHDEYEPWIEWFSREVLATPVRAFPEHKRSFLPSREEQKHISKIVHALKMGWTKTRKEIAAERKRKRVKTFYNLWGSTTEEEKTRGIHKHIPAPRRALPSHAESYNPPPEYLLDNKEMKEWNKLSETPWKRKYTFLPTKHDNLRSVAAYPRFIRERFLRCLDLYLAPRAIHMRLTISPEDLVPKLPSPRELQPFPTHEALVFKGHTGLVRSADFDPSGQYAVSGSDDGTVKVWETSTGRCLRTITLNSPVTRVAWTPAAGLSLVAAAVGNRLLLLNPGQDIGAHKIAARTDELLEEPPPSHDVVMDERTSTAVQWEKVKPEEWAIGVRVAVTHFKPVIHLAWHGKGDYIAVTLQDGASRAVVVHQLSRRRSQLPFSKAKGLVQCALFHPVTPRLFVATQRVVRIYDLVKQELIKKLLTGAQWVSAMAVHPAGDNLLVASYDRKCMWYVSSSVNDLVKQELIKKLLTGAQWVSAMAVHPAGDNLLVASYDRKCMWFDLELSSKPYQTLRLHGGAVRAVAFHRRYPLFASAGDDHNIVVSHGMVYNDLLQNPLLVPLKQLRGPEKREDLCVLDIRFHPTQPWLLAAGADSTLRLYT